MAAFDAVAFAMGKAGMSRDVVSALMGGSGGGGSGTLETSGWVTSTGGKAVVSGNSVSMPVGSSSTQIDIAPPLDISSGANHYFYTGDKFEIAIKVTDVSNRCSFTSYDNSKGTGTSQTGLFTFTGVQCYATETGTDVLTWEFTGTDRYLRLSPRSSGGSSSSTVSATVEITGIKFNGTVIFGKV